MQEGDDLLEHIKKCKALLDQFASVDVPMRNEDVVITLLESAHNAHPLPPPPLEYLEPPLHILKDHTQFPIHTILKDRLST